MSQPAGSTSSIVKRIGRKLGRIGIALLVVIALLAVGGLAYQSISEANDLQRYQPSGRTIDVGGRRMHLYCTGTGSPTVVLESGLAGPALQWILVQQVLDKTVRVCSYDRAGLGWSDPGPMPRTSQQMVDELHALLKLAGISGPYVLVGHSLGGFNVRLFAHQYPDEVVGMVLVAAGSEDDYARMPPEYRQIDESNRQTDRLLPTITRLGLTRLAGQLGLLAGFEEVLKGFPSDLRAEMTALTFYRSQYWDTAYAELSALDQSKAQVAAAGSLGNLPLIVLSGSPDLSRLPASFPVSEIRNTARLLQDELAALSTNSVHIVYDTCDHYIPMTKPDMVVQAVEQMLSEIRH